MFHLYDSSVGGEGREGALSSCLQRTLGRPLWWTVRHRVYRGEEARDLQATSIGCVQQDKDSSAASGSLTQSARLEAGKSLASSFGDGT